MLTDTRSVWFPVLVGGEVRAKLELTEKDGKWLAGEFGRPRTAQEIMRVRGTLPAGGIAFVRIPAIFVQMFLVTTASGDSFVPVRRDGLPEGFEPGKIYAADALLVPLATRVRGLDEKTVR